MPKNCFAKIFIFNMSGFTTLFFHQNHSPNLSYQKRLCLLFIFHVSWTERADMTDTLNPPPQQRQSTQGVVHPPHYHRADKDRSLPAVFEDSLLSTTSAGTTSCRAYATTLLAGQLPITWGICNITILPKKIYNPCSLKALKTNKYELWELYHVSQWITRTHAGVFATLCTNTLDVVSPQGYRKFTLIINVHLSSTLSPIQSEMEQHLKFVCKSAQKVYKFNSGKT